MTRKSHETIVAVGLATLMGASLGYVLDNLPLGLAMGAVLPITWAAQRCRAAR